MHHLPEQIPILLIIAIPVTSLIETVSATEKYRMRCEDRIGIVQTDERTVIVVADGAGGIGSGDRAAEFVVGQISSNCEKIHSADDWAKLLSQIDQQIVAGESTAVVVDVRPYGIAGASVGDSRAWVIHNGEVVDLTSGQVRKPLLGTGESKPVGFISPPLDGLLFVATDGFFDYAKREDIARLVAQSEFYEIPRRCIELVRLPSGDLWDDVGIVVARNKPRHRTRQTYHI